MHAHMHARTHARTHARMHAHTHTHTHTYTHTHTDDRTATQQFLTIIVISRQHEADHFPALLQFLRGHGGMLSGYHGD